MSRIAVTAAQHDARRARTHAPGRAPRTRDRLELLRLTDVGGTIPPAPATAAPTSSPSART